MTTTADDKQKGDQQSLAAQQVRTLQPLVELSLYSASAQA